MVTEKANLVTFYFSKESGMFPFPLSTTGSSIFWQILQVWQLCNFFQFYLTWSNLLKVANLDLIWNDLIPFDSIWSSLIQFEKYWSILKQQLNRIWFNLIQFFLIWKKILI